MIKHILFAGGLAFAASPKSIDTNPYAKYDVMLDHAQSNIAKTQAAISEMQAMNEAKVEEVAHHMDSVKAVAQEMQAQIEVVNKVFYALKMEVPGTYEEWQEDSIRTANMQRINKVDEKVD